MAVNLSPVGGVAGQFFDNNGNPLSGGKIYTYAAGTTTPQATYTTASGGTAHTNPIVLDSAGRVPSGEIWLTDGLSYKFEIKTSTEVLIGTYDNVIGINSNFVNFTNEQEIQTATAGQTVFTLTTMQYAPATNSLSVFVDGVNQYGPGALFAYVETDSTTVTFTTGLHVGAEVKFTTSNLNSSAGGDAANVSYTPPFVGSVTTNVEAKLAQTVNVTDFGAVGDGVTDDTAAIQAAIDSISGQNGVVNLFGTHLVSSPIISTKFGITIQGGGIGQSELLASHLTGPVIQFRKSYSTIVGVRISATSARSSAAYNTSNCGILLGDYDWTNPTATAGASGVWSRVQQCNVRDQPGHGILINVGGARIIQNSVTGNKGHGIYVDDGTSIGVAPSVLGFPGWAEIIQNRTDDSGGHGICVGNPTSAAQPPYRIRVSNNDVAFNATDAAVRNTNHQIYIVAEQVFTDLNGINAVSSGGVFVAGRNHIHFNNRFLVPAAPVYHVGEIATFSTAGISIEDFRVSGAAVNPAVSIDAALTSLDGVRVRCDYNANITNIVDPADFNLFTEVLYRDVSFVRGGLRTWNTPSIPVNSSSTSGTGMNIDNSGQIIIKSLASATSTFEHNKVNYASGTVSYQTFRVDGVIVGSITSNGTNTNYAISSDYRLKENFAPIQDALTRVAAIPVYRFNFKSNPTKTVDGFVAHELADHVPEAVVGEKDAVDADGNPKYQGVDQAKIVPLLTASIQAVIKRLEDLENFVKKT